MAQYRLWLHLPKPIPRSIVQAFYAPPDATRYASRQIVRVFVRERDTKPSKTVLLGLLFCADFVGSCKLACVGV